MTATRAALLTAVLAVAATAWVLSIQQMEGMDMGVATDLGSLRFFVAAWIPMMAAMMLPGALPALARHSDAERPALAVPQFAVAYLAAWTVVGLVVYALYRPHGTVVAGVLTVAAGVYELTPLKRACRRRCREDVRSGAQFGVYCIGSSIGLMLVLLALGAMSVLWMVVVAAVVVAQKLLPPIVVVDASVAIALVGLGIAIAV